MAYYSPRDEGFWEMQPDYLQSVQDACTPLGLNVLHFVLGDPDDATTPAAGMLEMPPGFVLERHAHPAYRFEVVVKGTLDVGERVLVPGDVMVSPPGELYGPHVAGPDGCTTLEFHASINSVGNITYDGDAEPTSYRA